MTTKFPGTTNGKSGGPQTFAKVFFILLSAADGVSPVSSDPFTVSRCRPKANAILRTAHVFPEFGGPGIDK